MGWAFGIVGLLLGATGLHLVLTWPLAGAYNMVMGEPGFMSSQKFAARGNL